MNHARATGGGARSHLRAREVVAGFAAAADETALAAVRAPLHAAVVALLGGARPARVAHRILGDEGGEQIRPHVAVEVGRERFVGGGHLGPARRRAGAVGEAAVAEAEADEGRSQPRILHGCCAWGRGGVRGWVGGVGKGGARAHLGEHECIEGAVAIEIAGHHAGEARMDQRSDFLSDEK